MNRIELAQLEDPDLYAAELQHWLMTEGPRSPAVRQMMRLARRHPDAELDRIFETKLAEYKRALREERVPTFWNLPVRGWEWLTDNARFTPPREVLMTLVYVVLVLVAFEGLKNRLPIGEWLRERGEVPTPFRAISRSQESFAPHRNPAPADVHERVDDWFAAELTRAASSDIFRQALAVEVARSVTGSRSLAGNAEGSDHNDPVESLRQLVREQILEVVTDLDRPIGEAVTAAIASENGAAEIRRALASTDLTGQTVAAMKAAVAEVKLPEQLAGEVAAKLQELDVKAMVHQAIVASLADIALKERVAVILQKALAADESRIELQGVVKTVVRSSETRAAFEQNLQSWLKSDDFRKQLTKAMTQASAAEKKDEPPGQAAAETVPPSEKKGDGG